MSFVADGLVVRRQRQRIWFEQWLREGYSIRQLSAQSGHGERTLRRVVGYWLNRPPVDRCDLSTHRHLIIDGTYLHGRRGAVVVVMDAATHAVIAGAYGIKEGSAQMGAFCTALVSRGLSPISITTDGHTGLLRVLRTLWPQAILQRCLFHIQIQGLDWCRRKPKRRDARRLAALLQHLLAIDTPPQRDAFLDDLCDWESRYGWRLALQRETGWVTSDLIRARSMIAKAVPDMFHYLDNPAIPRTTSAVEGYYGRLKPLYARHRGLAPPRRTHYFQWFLHLCQR